MLRRAFLSILMRIKERTFEDIWNHWVDLRNRAAYRGVIDVDEYPAWLKVKLAMHRIEAQMDKFYKQH